MHQSSAPRHRGALRPACAPIEVLERRRLLAAVPTFVSDVNTDGLGSSPRDFVLFEGDLYFSAHDDQHGRELWRYDGVTATRLTDFETDPGFSLAGPEELTVFRDALYFRAYTPQTGNELWKFDGTHATLVADIDPGEGAFARFHNSSPHGLTVIGDTLYFSADDGLTGREIWTYDATTISRLADLNPGRASSEPFTTTFQFTEFAGAIYFIANPGDNSNRLFRYDGQAFERVDHAAGGPPINFFSDEGFLTVFDGALYFSAGVDGDNFDRELWAFDGQSISLVADIREGPDGSHPRELFAFDDTLYFSAFRPETGRELYRFDGQSASLAADVIPGPADHGIISYDPAVFAGDLYFTARGRLYRLDPGSTTPVPIGASYVGADKLEFEGALYFLAEFQPSGPELARYDGAGITLAADLRPGTHGSGPSDFAVFGGELFFSADQDASSHDELWAYDGDAVRLADPSGDYFQIEDPTPLAGKLYFTAANDDDDGWEVWRHDGDHSTRVLGDHNGFALYPPGVTAFAGKLLFWAHRGIGEDGTGGDGEHFGSGLWAFDGQTATLIAPNLHPDYNNSHEPYGFTELNGVLYFAARSDAADPNAALELWRYDGATASRAPGIAPGTLSLARELAAFDGALYFGASRQDGSDTPGLWTYNGASARRVADISNPASFEPFDGSLYFFGAGDELGHQLWKLDPMTDAVTRLTDQLDPTGSVLPYSLTALGRTLYFWAASDRLAHPRLWAFEDGEARPISNLFRGSEFALFGGDLYFGADDGLRGHELWKLSGADSGLGDATGDGRVNAADFFAIDRGRALRLTGYANGDFNHSGGVADADDYMLIDRVFMGQSAGPGPQSSAPAPAPVQAAPVAFPGDSGHDAPPVWDEDADLLA